MPTGISNLRKTGISAVGDLAWGAHFCQFYENKQDLLDILTPFFRAGLENNERCLWVTYPPVDVVQATDVLRRTIPGADRYLKSGAMRVVAYDKWHYNDGVFDLAKVIEGWKIELKQALSDGYEGLRANGNASWVNGEHWSRFAEYEHRLNKLFEGHRTLIVCTYPLTAKESQLFDVAGIHQFALSKREGNWAMNEVPALKLRNTELKKRSKELELRVSEGTEELAASTEQLRGLTARFQSAREEEGRRIAREIHDELGSALASLKWDLDWLLKTGAGLSRVKPSVEIPEKLEQMKLLTESTLRAVQRLASELRPSVLDDLGLVEALEWQAQQFQERTGIACHFDSSIETAGLGTEQSTAVFRIFQESLTNILRHANARHVVVRTERSPGEFVLVVQDDGKGITDDEKNHPSSLGLLGMRERARLVAGHVDIEKGETRGTLLTLRVPVS